MDERSLMTATSLLLAILAGTPLPGEGNPEADDRPPAEEAAPGKEAPAGAREAPEPERGAGNPAEDAGAGKGGAPDGKEGRDEREQEGAWLEATEAAKLMSRELRPAVLLFGGDAGFARRVKQELFPDPSIKLRARRFVRIEVPAKPGKARKKEGDGDRETDARRERFGLVPGRGSLLLLDFEGGILARFDRKVPGDRTLARALRRAERGNLIRARVYRKARKAIDVASTHHRKKSYRKAYFILEPILEWKHLSSALRKEAEDLLEKMRRLGEAKLQQAEAMDRARRYARALELFQEAEREFPFPEIVKKARRRFTEVWRKVRWGL